MNKKINFADRNSSEFQLSNWENDGGNQYLYADYVFVNGRLFFGKTARLHKIISEYWHKLAAAFPQAKSIPEKNHNIFNNEPKSNPSSVDI